MRLDEVRERLSYEKGARCSKQLYRCGVDLFDRSLFVSNEVRIGSEIEQRPIAVSLDFHLLPGVENFSLP